MTENNPLKSYLETISPQEKQQYKTMEDVQLARENWKLEQDRSDAKKRDALSLWLRWISVSWLGFSGVVIVLCGRGVLKFGQETIVTFIAGSLLEVFGLWKIALNYFFDKK